MEEYGGWIAAAVIAGIYSLGYYAYAGKNESVPLLQPIQLTVIAAGMLWMALSDASTASIVASCIFTAVAFAGNFIELDRRTGKAILYTLWQLCAVGCILLWILVAVYMIFSVFERKKK